MQTTTIKVIKLFPEKIIFKITMVTKVGKNLEKMNLHCSTFCSGNAIKDFLKNNKENNYEKCLKYLKDRTVISSTSLVKIYVKELRTVKLRKNWCSPIHFSIIYTARHVRILSVHQ